MKQEENEQCETPVELVICVMCTAMLFGMLLYYLGAANLLLTVVGCAILLLFGCVVYSAWRIWMYKNEERDEYATIPEMRAL